jgi:two-component system, NarL family, nitrate/nitrite response regulator NarL
VTGFNNGELQPRRVPLSVQLCEHASTGGIDRPGATLRIALVAAVRLYREGLATELAAQRGYSVVGAAGGADEATAVVAFHRPDVVLIDIAMPSVRELVVALRAAHPAAQIVMFAVDECERDIDLCAEAGVAAFVTRDVTVADLVAAIEASVRGELSCSPRAAALLFRRCSALSMGAPVGAAGSPDVDADHVATLTSREREIAGLVAEGRSNKQIGRSLNIALATVKNHVHSILRKLDVATRAEAALRLRAAALRN